MILLELGSLKLDLDNCANAWRVTSFDPGFPEVREVDLLRPLQDGVIDETRYFGPRVITVNGVLIGYLTDTVQAALDQLMQFLHPRLRPTLTVQLNPKEQPRQAVVRVADESGLRRPVTYNEFQVSWVAADPYWYQLGETSIQLSLIGFEEGGRRYDLRFDRRYPPVAGGQGVGIALVRGMETPPRIKIFGFCVNPRIINQTNGKQLAFIGTVGEGEYLDIDTTEHTVWMNSDPFADRYSWLDFAASDWWLLEPGENILRFTADDIPIGSAAHAVVSWRERNLV